MLHKRIYALFTAMVMAITVTACGNSKNMKEEAAAKAPGNSIEMYEVFKDGRDYVFYDRALFNEFLQVGETPFRLTKIGEGPGGMTVVFGLTKSDKKLKSTIPAIELYEGRIKSEGEFYAEMIREGRIYVFNKWEDMKPVRDTGYPIYHYTEIGAGPKGETVVYVLNHDNKKHKPEALIRKFKEMQAK